MRALWRPVGCLLSACLVWSLAGCFSGYDYAHESGSLLAPGMSMEEVQGELGDPIQIVRSDADTQWIYRYESGPGTACIILMIVFFVVLIVALVASKSKGHVGGGVFFGVGVGSGGPPYHIRVHFDSEGRLREVSPPYLAP